MFGIVMLVLFICMLIAVLGYLCFIKYEEDGNEEGNEDNLEGCE